MLVKFFSIDSLEPINLRATQLEPIASIPIVRIDKFEGGSNIAALIDCHALLLGSAHQYESGALAARMAASNINTPEDLAAHHKAACTAVIAAVEQNGRGMLCHKGIARLYGLGDAWERAAAALASAREADRVARAAAESARREAQAREAREKLKLDAAALVAGQQIPGGALVDLARHHGIDVHPRTAGTLIKRVVSIGFDGARVRGAPLSAEPYKLARQVRSAIEASCQAEAA